MKKLMILLPLAFSPTAMSGEATAPLFDDLARCARMQDARDRLGCFDQLAARGAASAPSSMGASAFAPKSVSPSFGKEKQPGNAESVVAAAEKIQAHVAGLRFIPPDAYAVTLDNGQSWRHEDMQQAVFLREGDAITITRATLGTYRLTRDAGSPKNWIRVTRVR